jgi:hypothetical protein
VAARGALYVPRRWPQSRPRLADGVVPVRCLYGQGAMARRTFCRSRGPVAAGMREKERPIVAPWGRRRTHTAPGRSAPRTARGRDVTRNRTSARPVMRQAVSRCDCARARVRGCVGPPLGHSEGPKVRGARRRCGAELRDKRAKVTDASQLVLALVECCQGMSAGHGDRRGGDAETLGGARGKVMRPSISDRGSSRCGRQRGVRMRGRPRAHQHQPTLSLRCGTARLGPTLRARPLPRCLIAVCCALPRHLSQTGVRQLHAAAQRGRPLQP